MKVNFFLTKGNYVLGQKHGKGKFTRSDGSVYDGSFRANKIDGYGVFTWKDGRVFKGD